MSRRPFSMIREFHLADWFTLGNAVFGTAAIFSSLRYVASGAAADLYWACAQVLCALVFDVLDGRIARWRQQASAMGRELDSLADVISFGVAPAAIGYALGMQSALDCAVLFFFVACGVSRLARYNITTEAMSGPSGKVTHFEGTPIPTSVLLVLLLTAACAAGAVGPDLWLGEASLAGLPFHPLVLAFALSGSLMISRIRIPKP